MEMNLAKSAGFCFGVKRALNIAFETAKSNKNIEMLGDIVHNEDLVKEVRRAGIKNVKALSKGKDKILLIRAHGAPLKIYKEAKALGYKIIDATCPMVKEIHRIAVRMEKIYENIIIIGDEKHDEVLGIIGHLKNKAIIIENPKKIPINKIKKIKKACIVVQSTQNIDKVFEIIEILKQHLSDLTFFNTICKPTRTKQEEIKTMPLENDVMIIIGSKNSANTKRLYEISKSLNKRSYWIQSSKDIKKSWFENAGSVGLTAGASTPNYTTRDIIKHIRKLT